MRVRVHGNRFFDTFSRLAGLLAESARLQSQVLMEPPRRDELVARVSALEQEASLLREEVVAEIGQVPVTPLDRTDVHLLATHLHGLVALLDGNARQAQALDPGPAPEPVARLAEVLVRAADRLEATVGLLREREAKGGAEPERLDKEADAISDAGVEALFTGSPDPMEALKWSELYDALTDAVHQVRDTESLVRNIVR